MVEKGHLKVIKDVIIPLGAKPLEAWGETASNNYIIRKNQSMNINS